MNVPAKPSPTIEEVISEYQPMVSSVCRRMIQDQETVKDAAQEVWLEVFKSLPSFRGESKLSTWIYSITSRVVVNYARKERAYSTRFLKNYFHQGDLEPPYYHDFDHEVWVREMCDRCLTGILRCLDPESRLAYVFRDVAELTYPEIAEVLGKDEAAARKTVSRARQKLQRFLKEECALHHPADRCRCRMKKWVAEVDLPKEYRRLRETVRRINFYRASEMILPDKKFWQECF